MSYVRWFQELTNTDVGIVGGKNASLGELFHALGGADAPVPDGFAVTAAAYRDLIARNGLAARLHQLLDGIQPHDTQGLMDRARQCRELVREAELPERSARRYRDGLRAPRRRAGSRHVGRGSQLGNCGRPAASELRGSARKLPQRARPDRLDRCVSPLPRESIHRSSGAVPHQQRFRPFRRSAVDRHPTNDPRRSGLERRRLHAGHRNRFS